MNEVLHMHLNEVCIESPNTADLCSRDALCVHDLSLDTPPNGLCLPIFT